MSENELRPLTPMQTFEDNMRPAQLLLRVYRLLDSKDTIASDGDMIKGLRNLLQAPVEEELLLIYNELFLGLVRERADIKRSHFLQHSLAHLLRQAVVTSCTALDVYLPALLKANMPIVIRALGRGFIQPGDDRIQVQFKDLRFDLDDALRLLEDPNAAADYLSAKILSYTTFSYLSHSRGIHVTAKLLGVKKPWEEIAAHLSREKKDLTATLDQVTTRRNDIVHRADRSQTDLGGKAQDVSYPWAKHAVDTIEGITLALDHLVQDQIKEFRVGLGISDS